MNVPIADLEAHLKKDLSPARYRHTRAVARWAVDLARLHGEDPDRARRAGLLHDLAKEMPGPALARYVRAHRVPVPGAAEILRRKAHALLHAHVSAHRAAREWGEKDRGVLSAVARHTLGHPRLSRLDQILYVADFSSPDRPYGAARAVRRLARRDLRAALRETVRRKIEHVVFVGRFLHPETVRLWNALA